MALTGYILTPALDGPDMLHLDPLAGPDGCGGRTWGSGDLETDRVMREKIDKKSAEAMLDKGLAVACRRCGLRERAVPFAAPAEVPAG